MKPVLWAAAFAMAIGPAPASFAQSVAQTQNTAQAEKNAKPIPPVRSYSSKKPKRPVISVVTKADAEEHQRKKVKITMSRD